MRSTSTFRRLVTALIIISFHPAAGEARARLVANEAGSEGRRLYKTEALPALDFAVHDIGRMAMTVTNYGQFGTGDMACSAGSFP